MVTQRSLQALIKIWHELPLLIGPSWVEVHARMCRHLDEILTCQDPVERDWMIYDLLGLLRPHSAAAARLEEVRTILGMEPGTRSQGRIQPTPLPGWPELLNGAAHRLDPPLQTRFTDVTAPGLLPLGRRGVVTLRLTLEPETQSLHAEELVIRLDQALVVQLVTFDRRLDVLGKRVKELVVDRDADSEPVVFYILGREPGEASVRIILQQNGQTVGAIPLAIEVVDESTAEDPLQVPAAAVQIGGPYAPPVDLDFQVLLRQSAGHTTFCFVLNSPTGAVSVSYREFLSDPIVGSPETYQNRLVRSLERLDSARQLNSIGENLFEDLIPRELGALCREILESPARTLQITSEEPWIPWELLKPETHGNAPELFWCERFDITRWLSGRVTPSPHIQIERLVCVEASTDAPEKLRRGATEDLRYLSELARRNSIDDASLSGATSEQLCELLDRGEVDLWHFAASDFIDEHEAMIIRLVNGRFTPLDLDRRRRRKIAQKRPLVVLNVSGAGRQAHSLTGLGGWASVWVERSRCGAFVAPLWTIDGEFAHAFSRAFYEALQDGETLGQAVSSARQAVRREGDGDPTWLAYSVYGHPNARIVLGSRAESPLVAHDVG